MKRKLLGSRAERLVHTAPQAFCHAAEPGMGADFESAQGNLRGLDPFNL